MAKMKNKRNRNVHVYVMRSKDGLVKVGISENVIYRAYSEYLEKERKEIVGICYTTEKFDIKTARIYEAAIIGFHRRYIINGSEWLSAQWRSVADTLTNMVNGEVSKIQTDVENQRNHLNDEYMKNLGYTRKYYGKCNRAYYLKFNGDTCSLVWQTCAGQVPKLVCSLSIDKMMDYLTENGMRMEKKF